MTQETINLDYDYINLFPLTLHHLQIDEFENKKQELIEFAYNLRESTNYNIQNSNRGGWQSDVYTVKGDNFLESLLLNIFKSVPAFNDKIHLDSYYWLNINPTGAYNTKHNHPNSDLAGVLWLKIPKDSGDIIFISPKDFTSFIEIFSYTDEFKRQTNNYHTYNFLPKEGTMLMFPSHLQHKVEENKSNDDRISVSFNIKIRHEQFT
tara:strand:+ start:13880 stop:14500 length:621 start_codon:yes stop_codon:yes gene_type:complete